MTAPMPNCCCLTCRARTHPDDGHDEVNGDQADRHFRQPAAGVIQHDFAAGVLKNGIDWLSHPASDFPRVFGDGGALKDEGVQQQLRQFMQGFVDFVQRNRTPST
ncbi:MAG: hypothetical protein ACHQIL_11375 [Steroidobacterales bacterium]